MTQNKQNGSKPKIEKRRTGDWGKRTTRLERYYMGLDGHKAGEGPKQPDLLIGPINPETQQIEILRLKRLVPTSISKIVQKVKHGNHLLKNRYVANNVDVWCMDATSLGPFSVFVVIEMLSRKFLSYSIFRGRELLASDIIATLESAIMHCGSAPEILHGDMAAQYKSAVLFEFLDAYDIKLSQVDSKARSNQVIESAFNAFKTIVCDHIFDLHLPQSSALYRKRVALRKKLNKLYPSCMREAFYSHEGRKVIFNSRFFVALMEEQGAEIIEQAVFSYNSKKHPQYFGPSRSKVFYYASRWVHVRDENMVLTTSKSYAAAGILE